MAGDPPLLGPGEFADDWREVRLDAGAMWWHLGYLVGLALLVVAVTAAADEDVGALAADPGRRHRGRRRLRCRADARRRIVTSTVTWFAIGRSMRWPPLVGAPLVAAAVVLGARLAIGPGPGPIGVAGAIGQVLVFVSLAFVADDAVAATAPGVPTTARVRLAIRLVLGVAVVVGAAAGVAVLITAVGVAGSAIATPGSVACAAIAFSVAVLVGRLSPVPSPGAIGAAVAVVGASTGLMVPASWREALPDGDRRRRRARRVCSSARLAGNS